MTTYLTTQDVLNNFGICVQKGSDTTHTLAGFKDLGLNLARTDAPISAGEYPFFLTLAQGGVKFDIIVNGWEGQAMVDTQLGFIRQLQTAVPGSVVYIEGPNEVNNNPQQWNIGGVIVQDAKDSNVTNHKAAIACQTYIYNTVKADPILKGCTVICYTDEVPISGAGICDLPNMHVYDNSTPNGPVDWWLISDGLGKLEKANPSMTGFAVTEWGTANANATVHADYILQGLVTHGQMKTSVHFLYNMQDNNGQVYGLYDANWVAKPAVASIAAFIKLLSIPTPASKVAPVVTLTDPTNGTVETLLVARPDGSYLLNIWTWNIPTKAFNISWSLNVNATYNFQMLNGQVGSLSWSHPAGTASAWNGYDGTLLTLIVTPS